MTAGFFLRGLMIGLSIAAPVGPIGVLCIRRTLAGGRRIGFVSGLGAAAADALYGCVAGFGLTLLSEFLVGQLRWLQPAGGLFLIFLGLKTFFSRPAQAAGSEASRGLAGAFASTFLLTLTNPMTILSFTAVFAGLGLGEKARDGAGAGLLVAGVFFGSAAWWLFLSCCVGLFQKHMDAKRLRWINWISGAVIVGFGLLALVHRGK